MQFVTHSEQCGAPVAGYHSHLSEGLRWRHCQYLPGHLLHSRLQQPPSNQQPPGSLPNTSVSKKKSFICVPESEPTFPPMSLNPKTSDLRLQHGGRITSSSFPFVSMISLYYPFILISEWKRQLWSKKAFDHRPKRRKCGPGWWMTMLVDCWWMIGIWNYPWLNNVDDSDRRLGQINILIEPSPRGGGGAILTLSNTLKQGNFFKAACDLFMYDAFDHWYILMQRYL